MIGNLYMIGNMVCVKQYIAAVADYPRHFAVGHLQIFHAMFWKILCSEILTFILIFHFLKIGVHST